MRYRVHCQNSVGRTLKVDVQASTDEEACNAALRLLNSWRAVRALTVTKAEIVPTMSGNAVSGPLGIEEHGTVRREGRGPKVIREATVIDFVALRKRGPVGTVGAALLAATKGGSR